MEEEEDGEGGGEGEGESDGDPKYERKYFWTHYVDSGFPNRVSLLFTHTHTHTHTLAFLYLPNSITKPSAA